MAGLPSNEQGINDDPDDDGRSNLEEFVEDTNPNAPDTATANQTVYELKTGDELGLSGDMNSYPLFTLRIHQDAANVIISPQAAVDLPQLTSSPTQMVETSGPVADGDFLVYTYRSPIAVEQTGKVFFRFEYSLPTP